MDGLEMAWVGVPLTQLGPYRAAAAHREAPIRDSGVQHCIFGEHSRNGTSLDSTEKIVNDRLRHLPFHFLNP